MSVISVRCRSLGRSNGSETDHRVQLLRSCVTSSDFFDARGETLGRVLLNCRAIGAVRNRTKTYHVGKIN